MEKISTNSLLLLYFLPSWALLLVSFSLCLPHQALHILLTLIASITAAFLWSYGTWQALFSQPAEHLHGKGLWSTSLVIGCSFLATALLVILGGIRHDQISYLGQWATINAGSNPWSDPSNTYFPLHAFLAPLAAIHPLLVKCLFAVISFTAILLSALGPVVAKERLTRNGKVTLFMAIALSPYTIITIYWLGLNDALTGSFMLLATILATRWGSNTKTEMLAGCLIALGACLKMYPLLVAPFFLVRKRKIQWSFLGGCAASLIIVLAASFGLWGESTFDPFVKAGTREPTFLSPFNALYQINIDATRYSTLLMLLALAACFFYYLIRNIDFPTAVAMGLAIALFFYRVGHLQFLAFVVFFTPFLIRHWSSIFDQEATAKLSTALLTWVGFLNWFQLQYALNCGMTLDTPSRIFRDHGAWPYAIVLTLTFATFIKRMSMPLGRSQIMADSDSPP
ncbi:MAG: glycosyltransferase family 87 protein [Cyanobium sp.]